MNNTRQEQFLSTLKQQFADIFTSSKAGKDTAELRLRTQGFIYAGDKVLSTPVSCWNCVAVTT